MNERLRELVMKAAIHNAIYSYEDSCYCIGKLEWEAIIDAALAAPEQPAPAATLPTTSVAQHPGPYTEPAAQPAGECKADTLLAIYTNGDATKSPIPIDWKAWQRIADYVNAGQRSQLTPEKREWIAKKLEEQGDTHTLPENANLYKLGFADGQRSQPRVTAQMVITARLKSNYPHWIAAELNRLLYGEGK